MTKRVVAILGLGRVEADAWVLSSDDLGLTRGDGCFEATRVTSRAEGNPSRDSRQGERGCRISISHRVDHLVEHLDRFQASCVALDLPDVDREAWKGLIEQVLADWDVPGEAMLKLMLTRGRESTPTGPVTGIVTISPITDKTLQLRRTGLSVITLNRGTASDAFAAAPWLLGGVKTLSYAVNVAAGREAERRGADDVIFVSSDGYVLEGPTSAVVWLADGRLNTTPTEGTGILKSITQRALFAGAGRQGLRTAQVLGTPADLLGADGVWLVSSGRGVARVHSIDGGRLPTMPELSDRIAALADF